MGLMLSVFIIIGLAVYLDDPHGCPVFFQSRIGKDGKPFTMYKFRTMVKGAEEMKPDMQKLNEMDGPVFKIKKDPRMTHLGSYLRRTGLDELPQLHRYLYSLAEKGICIVYFSQSMEMLQENCTGIIRTRNGLSAKIDTFS